MRVVDLCTRPVEVASPEDLVRDAARRMAERGVGTLVVVDDLQRPLGIVTDRDLVLRCLVRPLDPRSTALSKVMSSPVVWVRQDASVESALEEMGRLHLRRLAVVDAKDRLVGLLSLDDALCSALAGDTPLGRALRSTMHDGTA